MTSSNDRIVIMCPPYPEYQEAPEDQPNSELFDCPKCNSQMWLSSKKKGSLMFASCLGKEIMFGCYDCIKKWVSESLGVSETIKADL